MIKSRRALINSRREMEGDPAGCSRTDDVIRDPRRDASKPDRRGRSLIRSRGVAPIQIDRLMRKFESFQMEVSSAEDVARAALRQRRY